MKKLIILLVLISVQAYGQTRRSNIKVSELDNGWARTNFFTIDKFNTDYCGCKRSGYTYQFIDRSDSVYKVVLTVYLRGANDFRVDSICYKGVTLK